MTDLDRHLRRTHELVATIASAEATLDQLLCMRRIAPELPDGFFRTDSIVPGPPRPETMGRLPNPGPDDLARTIGRRIREAREDRGWTQNDLSETTGIARPNIARLERGTGLPNTSTLLKIATGLAISLADLLRGP